VIRIVVKTNATATASGKYLAESFFDACAVSGLLAFRFKHRRIFLDGRFISRQLLIAA
jgi:hypothetical protein